MSPKPLDRQDCLILVKCLSESAVASYEKLLAAPAPKRVPPKVRANIERLQEEIYAAHLRMGALIRLEANSQDQK